MSGRNDRFTSYKMLVDQLNNRASGRDYTIGDMSGGQGRMFQNDAKQVMKERRNFDLLHAKLYLCALMQDLPITDTNIQRTVERVEEINEENLDQKSLEVLQRLG